MVDLVPNEEQRQIRDSVGAFLEARAPLARLHADSKGRRDLDLWPEAGALGWFGLAVGVEDGGLGLGAAEQMIVAFECGRFLLSPALVGTMIGAQLAAGAGEDALARSIIAGQLPVGVAIERDLPRESGGAAPVLLVDVAQDGPFCLWSPEAMALYPATALTQCAPTAPLDESAALLSGMLDLHTPSLSTSDPVVPARADMLVAAMLSGLAHRATEEAVSYAKIREQFGRPIGSFQAVKHICADMAVRRAAAAAQTLFAALALDGGLADFGREASAARVVAADAAIANAAAAVQIYGGIGYTEDCDAHFFVKRAALLSRIGGDVRAHERRLLEADPA